MYNEYFGLKENPFALSPDPRYLYLSQRHQDALAHLMYGITGGGGFVLLTGEVGTGKTLMIRSLLQRLPETVDLALVLYPFLTVREFMLALCDDLKLERPKEPTLKALIDVLNAFLLENHARGRRTVLIVDEAHRLNREVLEQIRLLTNLETTKEKLLQIVLVGQPELNGVLAQPEMRQLTQRITARYDLQPLNAREAHAYVLHRCKVAGARAVLFSTLALWRVQRLAQGVPRLLNILCDRALLAAYARGQRQVGLRLMSAAAQEVETGQRPHGKRTALLMAVIILAAGAGTWRWLPDIHAGWQRLWDINATEAVAVSTTPAPDVITNAATPPTTVLTVSPAPTPDLLTVLASKDAPTDTTTAFSLLFTRWGLTFGAFEGNTGCDRAIKAGLRCLFETGTWANLRLLNRPVIVELVDPAGLRHHVLASRLTEDRVVFEFPGQSLEFALNDVNRVWFGKYLALWSPPEIGEVLIRSGQRGAAVAWVRDVLAQVGLTRRTQPASNLFDAELEALVREFQRRHELQDDGVVGKMSLIYLSTYESDAVSPQLTGAREASRGR